MNYSNSNAVSEGLVFETVMVVVSSVRHVDETQIKQQQRCN